MLFGLCYNDEYWKLSTTMSRIEEIEQLDPIQNADRLLKCKLKGMNFEFVVDLLVLLSGIRCFCKLYSFYPLFKPKQAS